MPQGFMRAASSHRGLTYTVAMKLTPCLKYVCLAFLMGAGSSGLMSVGDRASAQSLVPAPWNASQETLPGQLAKTLASKPASKPIILQVGFDVLYRSKHIPGSIYVGPASTPEGLEKLGHSVRRLPKNATIYIYCGCCPMTECPNVRPAFETLRKMGFTNVHVVMLDSNFGKDWVAKGYPVAGESASPQ